MTDKTPIQIARDKYAKKRVNMLVGFNTETEAELLKAAKDMPKFSAWVKEQIKIYLKNKK